MAMCANINRQNDKEELENLNEIWISQIEEEMKWWQSECYVCIVIIMCVNLYMILWRHI